MPCRQDEGGKPQCRRGLACKSVELRGRSLYSIQQFRQNQIPYPSADSGPFPIVMIADSPENWDDKTGFIGHNRSLDKLIELCLRANLDLKQVFFTYITRCFSFNKPTIQEIKTCSQYTIADIEHFQPRVIVLLGSGPQRLFNLHNKGGVASLRGEVFTLPIPNSNNPTEYKILSTYDPGIFAYRSDSYLEARVLDDYLTVSNIAKGGDPSNQPVFSKYEVIKDIPSIKKFVDEVKQVKKFSFDTESSGIPWSKKPILCISFSLGVDKNYILPINEYGMKPVFNEYDLDLIKLLLVQIFESKEIVKAAHNIKYDANVLRKHLGIKIQGRLVDTMLMHHLLNEQKPHGLKFLSDVEFGIGNYAYKVEEIVGKGKVLKASYSDIPNDILWEYSATDTEYCYRLAEIYSQRLREKPHLWKLYWEETEPISKVLTDAEWYGHKVDMGVHANLVADCEAQTSEIITKIRSVTWEDFNPGSHEDVRNAFIKLGFEKEIRDSKKQTGYSVGKEILADLKDKIPLAKNVLEYRSVQKLLGTYLENIKNDLDDDGRVRYSFFIHGTESGRLSAKLLHQLPRVDESKKLNIKDVLIAEPGFKLVYFDYDQVEMRVLAELSKDKELNKIFCYPDHEAIDVHRNTASIALAIPYDKVSAFNRQEVGKSVNFGISYGSEGYRLVQKCQWEDDAGYKRPITWDMLNRVMTRFKRKHAGLTDYLESIPNIARRYGNQIATPFGRERRMGGKLNDSNEGARKAAEREIVNFVIQSTAVAITLRTIIDVYNWYNNPVNGIEEGAIRLINTVHDSGTFEVREDLVIPFAKQLKLFAEKPIPVLGNRVFPCKIVAGYTESKASKLDI